MNNQDDMKDPPNKEEFKNPTNETRSRRLKKNQTKTNWREVKWEKIHCKRISQRDSKECTDAKYMIIFLSNSSIESKQIHSYKP